MSEPAVTLTSPPGSYLTIHICPQSGDQQPPDITWVAPAPDAFIPTAPPRLELRYQDLPADGASGASGVDPATLRVFVDDDDVERTTLFTRDAGGAVATWPASLAFADGPHTLRAEVKDLAGNTGTGAAAFTVPGHGRGRLAVEKSPNPAWAG